MRSNRDTLRIVFLLCSVFFTLQVAPRWWSDSIVLDEGWEITSSYYYWKTGDVWTPCGTTAPGALCALPLLAMNLKAPVSVEANFMRPLRFLFLDNGGRLKAITAWSRSVHWLLGLLVGFILYRLVRGASLAEGVAAMVLWAFEPNLLGYFGTARTDALVAFWFLLCVAFYLRVRPSPRMTPFILTGFLAGLTSATRYYGILILPILVALEISHWGFQSKKKFDLKRFLARTTSLLFGAVVAVFLCYLPGTFRFPGHPSPFWFYTRYLSDYVGQRSGVSSANTFFAGKFWMGGSYLEFPFKFFFKNTAPFFILILLAAVLGIFKKIKFPDWMWIPPTIYLGLFFLADKSIDIHHTLVAYPFLILLAAKVFQWTRDQTRKSDSSLVKALPFLLLAWHPLSSICHFPRYLAYVNDFITPKQEAELLNSIDWDLGQDMKRLAEVGRQRGWKKVKLMTYQRTDPAFYGLPWSPWTNRDLEFPTPGEVYVLDPDISRDDPSYSRLISQSPWINHLPATGNVGGTLYYWEFPKERPLPPDRSPTVNSFPYYPDGIPPYPPLQGTDHER